MEYIFRQSHGIVIRLQDRSLLPQLWNPGSTKEDIGIGQNRPSDRKHQTRQDKMEMGVCGPEVVSSNPIKAKTLECTM